MRVLGDGVRGGLVRRLAPRRRGTGVGPQDQQADEPQQGEGAEQDPEFLLQKGVFIQLHRVNPPQVCSIQASRQGCPGGINPPARPVSGNGFLEVGLAAGAVRAEAGTTRRPAARSRAARAQPPASARRPHRGGCRTASAPSRKRPRRTPSARGRRCECGLGFRQVAECRGPDLVVVRRARLHGRRQRNPAVAGGRSSGGARTLRPPSGPIEPAGAGLTIAVGLLGSVPTPDSGFTSRSSTD